MKFDKYEFAYILIYISYFFTYFISLLIYGMGNTSIRYYFMAFAIAVGIIIYFLKRRKHIGEKKIYSKEILRFFPLCIIFFAFSCIEASKVGYGLDIRTYVQIALIIMPAIYAFLLINIISTKNLILLMKISLFSLIIIYFCEPSHNIIEFFHIDNYKKLTLNTTFTESSLCSETFFQLFLFFSLLRNIGEGKPRKNVSKYMWISAIFTILSWKRLAVLCTVIFLLGNNLLNHRKKVNKYSPLIIALIFTIITYYYTKFMQGTLFTNFDVLNFTTGRNYILSLWEKENYFSYGYGTSMLVIGRYLEMDLIQIYLELNLFCVFAYCYTLLKVANLNVYALSIVVYTLLNMLTASNLPMLFPWLILYITISFASETKCLDEGMENDRRKFNIKEKVRLKYGRFNNNNSSNL